MREITETGPLLTADGRLAQAGWSRRPLRDANLECAAPGWLRALRIKRWDYYGVWTPELYASATVSHVGYVGLAFVYVVDLRSGAQAEATHVRPLGRGCELPRNSDRGDVAYDDGRMHLCFELADGVRRLRAVHAGFDRGRGLRMEVELAEPPAHESIVMCTPMGRDRFYYNRKINGLRASGTIMWGERLLRAEPSVALGQLDWGRGVWPYRTHWLWGSGNGVLGDGRVLGLNLGAGFGDLSAGTENAIFLDGRLHKLGSVRFDCDPRDYTRQWHLTDDAGRLDLDLCVDAERVTRKNLGLLRTEVHQCFGRYHGTLVADDGERLTIENLPGFAEEHWARW